MKVVTNAKLIKRNAKIGQYTSIGALVILGIGLYHIVQNAGQVCLFPGSLVIGFLYVSSWDVLSGIDGVAVPAQMK